MKPSAGSTNEFYANTPQIRTVHSPRNTFIFERRCRSSLYKMRGNYFEMPLYYRQIEKPKHKTLMMNTKQSNRRANKR